jgi:transcriptional regulator with XRE-family HTH domain
MDKLNINRLRVILADKNLTNRWLADQLGVTEGTVSRWTTNSKQPPVDTFYKISVLLKVDIRDLFEPTLYK